MENRSFLTRRRDPKGGKKERENVNSLQMGNATAPHFSAHLEADLNAKQVYS